MKLAIRKLKLQKYITMSIRNETAVPGFPEPMFRSSRDPHKEKTQISRLPSLEVYFFKLSFGIFTRNIFLK